MWRLVELRHERKKPTTGFATGDRRVDRRGTGEFDAGAKSNIKEHAL
jgi:hypothetical protein